MIEREGKEEREKLRSTGVEAFVVVPFSSCGWAFGPVTDGGAAPHVARLWATVATVARRLPSHGVSCRLGARRGLWCGQHFL
jgi:hypothetical protein